MTAPTTPDLSWRRGEAPWLDPFLPALRAAGDVVLELGCGAGEDAADLASVGFRVVAFDVSRTMIAAAAENAPAASLFVADLLAPLPVRAAAVPVVVSSLSIHYFPWKETVAIAREVRRVLRPGGVFAFRVNATDDTNFGAGEGVVIEPNYYNVPPDGRNNRPFKRFFDDAAIRALLPGWRIAHLAHRTIHRYGLPKQTWECLAYVAETS